MVFCALHRLLWLLWSDFGSVFQSCGIPRPDLWAWHSKDSCSFSSPWLNCIYMCTLFLPGTWIACAFFARGQLYLVTLCFSGTWLDSTETPRTANLEEPVKKGKRECEVGGIMIPQSYSNQHKVVMATTLNCPSTSFLPLICLLLWVLRGICTELLLFSDSHNFTFI